MAMTPRAVPHEVRIEPAGLYGLLLVPEAPRGVVLFAHGSGSGRLSPRNNYVAGGLSDAGIASLLLDLLTPEEERDRRNIFDIEMLASRLAAATDWAEAQGALTGRPVGYFGASTGAAAALAAAADRADIAAVVSRGGRPDLAMDALPRVRAPTLLIVGSLDTVVIELNRRAYERLTAEKQLVVVAGASHLFEEDGTLEEVIRLARDWFLRWFAASHGRQEAGHDRPSPDLR
jgi:dienelactone hydrolase